MSRGGAVREFYVEEDMCTECGDCIKALPQAFRKVEDEEVAEVYNTNLDDAMLPHVEKMIQDCPGHAIKWR
jgi:ferredoxin